MNPKQLREILAAHADKLAQSQPMPSAGVDLPDDDDLELSSLLGVAERLKSALKPIAPPRTFESDLKQQLLTAAQTHQAQGYHPPNPERDLLVLMGIIGFVLSLAGVLVAWRLRSQTI